MDFITLASRCKSRLGVMMSTVLDARERGRQVCAHFPTKEAQFATSQTAFPVLVSLAMYLGDESAVGEPEVARPTILSCCSTAQATHYRSCEVGFPTRILVLGPGRSHVAVDVCLLFSYAGSRTHSGVRHRVYTSFQDRKGWHVRSWSRI